MQRRLTEPQPHLFGQAPQYFRGGMAVSDANVPPPWAPEMAHHPTFPYTLAEWERDVRRWIARHLRPSVKQLPPHLGVVVTIFHRSDVHRLPDQQLLFSMQYVVRELTHKLDTQLISAELVGGWLGK